MHRFCSESSDANLPGYEPRKLPRFFLSSLPFVITMAEAVITVHLVVFTIEFKALEACLLFS